MGGDWFIHGALILALVVVVPLAFEVNESLQGRSRLPKPLLVGAGAVASISFALPSGILGAVMCTPWFVLCVAAGLERVGRFRTIAVRLAYLLPHGYLVFGAGWLIVSRFGARPLDFPDVIVELTAVHFHFAGFVAPVVISATRDHQARLKQTLLVALVLALVASPLTAIGFVYSATVGAVGAIAFALGLFIWAVATIFVTAPRLPASPRALLFVAAASVLASMTMAAVYATGVAAGESWIDIPTMARTHGVLNAVGFSLCGSLAWRQNGRNL